MINGFNYLIVGKLFKLAFYLKFKNYNYMYCLPSYPN